MAADTPGALERRQKAWKYRSRDQSAPRNIPHPRGSRAFPSIPAPRSESNLGQLPKPRGHEDSCVLMSNFASPLRFVVNLRLGGCGL